jgi:N-acyl-D-amino-acid deacylase
MTYDVVITGSRIVDGTGAPAYPGDVAIAEGRIVAVGEVSGETRRTIDARGQVVAPGFIDAHTHYDAQLLWDPTANPATRHGVTTILMGNCGYTLAPVRPDDQDYIMGLFAAAEEVPKGALERYAPFQWETFPEYIEWLHGRIGVNVVTQIGHSALRRYVMGEDALERAATADEIEEMVRIAEAAMEAGAAGISSSQAPHQLGEHGEHIPSFFAEADETMALAEAVRRKGKRLLSINPRSKREGIDEEDKKLLSKLAEVSGAVVSWNDFGMASPSRDDILEFMEAELEHGREIYAIARCQRPETRFTLKKLSSLFGAFDGWPQYSNLSKDEKISALGDPEWRARLGAFWEKAPFMSHASVEMVSHQPVKECEGRTLADIAVDRGITPAEAMFDIAREDHLETFFRLGGKPVVDESPLERILKSPATLVGISDGGAHLQTFAGADYTTYFLQHWVRETGSFTLEEGVAALTSRVAEFLGLDDRGTIEVGKAADLTVFDPATVGPLKLQTLDDIPGGGTRMTKDAQAISWVIVNGEPVVENGVSTDAIPGRVLV